MAFFCYDSHYTIISTVFDRLAVVFCYLYGSLVTKLFKDKTFASLKGSHIISVVLLALNEFMTLINIKLATRCINKSILEAPGYWCHKNLLKSR